MSQGRMPAPAAEDSGAETVQLCSFFVGDEAYVIDIMRIREIVRPLPVTPVRRGSPIIEGVIDLRGQVIPIVDLRRLLGAPATGDSRAAKQLIVSAGGREVGLVVDRVGRVLTVARSEIRASPSLMERRDGRIFPGVANQGGRLYLLLDINVLLEGDLPTEADLDRLREAARAGETG